MTAKWKDRGTRILTYMSPFFSDPSAYSNSTTAFRHNFFNEGVANGYFVQNSNGSTYLMYSLSIKFAMLDLTNPAAVSWMQDIIINQSVVEAGSSGWMCDFGEYLPFDAVLHSVSYWNANFGAHSCGSPRVVRQLHNFSKNACSAVLRIRSNFCMPTHSG
jgi:alpha-glucosidase (family GH31 glycosyl hydrolase)